MHATLTEADILTDVITPDEGDFSEEAARSLLGLKFSEATRDRIGQLLNRNNRDELSDAERGDLRKYLRVGQLIDILQAKARASLRPSAADV
ncbi:MAG: hypothetical protein ACI8UO_004424 [Verrucomicrobiales bacterium]|jgi:hypothetical protein